MPRKAVSSSAITKDFVELECMGGARSTISSENQSAFLKGYCLELSQNGSNDPELIPTQR